jgi:hypothetical protein
MSTSESTSSSTQNTLDLSNDVSKWADAMVPDAEAKTETPAPKPMVATAAEDAGVSEFPSWANIADSTATAPAATPTESPPVATPVVSHETEEVSTDEFWHPAELATSAAEQAQGSNPYEKMLMSEDTPVYASHSSDNVQLVKATQDTQSSTQPEKAASQEASSVEDNSASSMPSTVDVDVQSRQPDWTPAAAAPVEQHFENPWNDLFSGSSQPPAEPSRFFSAPAEPVAVTPLSSDSNTNIAGGQDFAVWSAMSSLDSPSQRQAAAASSTSSSSDVAPASASKDTDWAAISNKLWDTSSSDQVQAVAAPRQDTGAISQMQKMLQGNSLLQRQKKGHMVSIKLHRGH